jgi:hypothetical protein
MGWGSSRGYDGGLTGRAARKAVRNGESRFFDGNFTGNTAAREGGFSCSRCDNTDVYLAKTATVGQAAQTAGKNEAIVNCYKCESTRVVPYKGKL